MLGSRSTYGRTSKKLYAGGNDLLEQIITGVERWIHFYQPSSWFGKKRGRGTEKIQKWVVCWTGDVNSYLGLPWLVYAEFGPDVCKEKWYITQDTYFDFVMHLSNAIWSKRLGLLGQKVVLINSNACPHRMQFIQTILKDFHWEQFTHPLHHT